MKDNALALEESLRELNEKEAYNLFLKKKRQRKLLIIAVAVIGLLIFSILVTVYLKQLS
ncbi:MAG: hypothetical protein MI975_06640 [Cytophagales bacterium]|nr:hypothetical protein [Cytophagales bacterium]